MKQTQPSGKNVVIIEDDHLMLRNLEIMTKTLGYNVVHKFERVDNIELDSALKDVQLILLDINLPGKSNGVQFARSIKDKYKIPVIFITGNNDPDIFDEASETMIHGFLRKPFSRDQLELTLKLSAVRTRYEQMLTNYMLELAQKEKIIAVGEFAGGMIHDLGNFNMLVLASFDLIDKTVDESLNDASILNIHKYVKRGRNGAQRINQLTQRYRKIVRSGDGDEPKLVKIQEVFDELEQYFAGRLERSGIALRKVFPEGLELHTNELSLLQCIVNLISNSAYELERKGGEGNWIELRVLDLGSIIQIDVVDSGRGIPPENVDKLFEPAFTTKDLSVVSGLGMGLYFIKKCVARNLRGEISFMRAEANTTFRMILPRQLPESKPA